MSELPQIVRERLKTSPLPGIHPDADVLTAFGERLLPESERALVMEHLARCGDCREVIALALPASEVADVATARIVQRGRAVSRRCFATDGKALVMPAFGAFTGGLNIRDRAFAAVFGSHAFTAHMLGDRKLYAFSASRCLSD